MPRRKSNHQSELLELALLGIDVQIAELEQKRAKLRGQAGAHPPSSNSSITNTSATTSKPRKKRRFSAAHRAKLRAAAQRRWGKATEPQAAVKRPQATAKKTAATSKATKRKQRT